MNQPRNSASLIAARNAGEVPALPVLISFAGPLDFDNIALMANVAESYDWRLVSGLEVEVFVSRSTPFADVLRHLSAVAAVVPKRMVLTFVEGPRVDCGERRIVRDEQGDFWLFDWFPMAIGPKFYVGASVITKRIWAALGNGTIPLLFDRAMDLVIEIAKEKQVCA